MLKIRQTLKAMRQDFGAKPPEGFDLAMHYVRPFYWLLLGGMLAMYGFTVYYMPELREPARLVFFTFLMILHGTLHWLSPHLTYKPSLVLPYIIGQGLLAFALILFSGNINLAIGLYAALIGEIVGMFRRSKQTILYVIFFLILSFLGYSILAEPIQPWFWLVTVVPIILFIWIYVSLYIREVEAREQAFALLKKLEVANQQLSEYANQVERLTLAAERERLARELHDTLAQGLAGLILQLEAADSHITRQNPDKAQTIIQQAMTRARTTLADARRAIGDLRETHLKPADLIESIQTEIQRFQDSTSISCTAELCPVPNISAQIAENALRAVSEGLVNIARHAQAREILLTMRCDEQNLFIEMRDDGIGFDPQEAFGRSGHYGLLGLRERARLSGGTLTIESQPSQGTTLKIQLPLQGPRPATGN